MGQTWQPRDAKKFQKWVRQQGLGVTVYTAPSIEQRVAPYEDKRLFEVHEFSWRSPITGNPMTGHMSAESLCAGFGPVYEEPPAGIRHMATPGPQVAGPLGNGHRILDRDELNHLTKLGREARQQQRKAGRRGWL